MIQKKLRPKLVDFDKEFENTPNARIVPCGIEATTQEDPMQTNKDLFFLMGDDPLTVIASCNCGELRGNYYEGLECPICKTVCQTRFVKELKFKMFYEVPEFCPPVLHPITYVVLNKWLGSAKNGKASLLDRILNPREQLPDDLVGLIPQGYRAFYENFDDIMRFFLQEYKKFQNAAGRKRMAFIPAFLREYRKIIFVRHIPVLNESLHILTSSGTMLYTDEAVYPLLDMKTKMTAIINDYSVGKKNQETYMLGRLFAFSKASVAYITSIIDTKLVHKAGHIRRSVMGTRLHCTFRAVIVQHDGVVRSDEVYLPWKLGVTIYELEIENLLMHRYNFSMPDAVDRTRTAVLAYDPLIDEILQTLIRECQEGTGRRGLPILFGRNPTIRIGGIMLLFVTKIKPDINDDTVSICAKICPAANFDFDGDAMNGLSIKEQDKVDVYMKLHPRVLLLASGEIGISSDVKLTSPVMCALNAWLTDPSQFD